MIEDRDARERAITSTANLVVTAGAGTGKTTLLIERVLHQVLVRGLDLGRILMMTFTEKAANEMRRRLEDFLRKRSETGEREVRRLRALASVDRAEIGTIHGFCAHVLREYPIEAGVDPGFEVDRGERFEDLFRREWPRWLDRELGSMPPRPDVWRRVLERADIEELEAMARTFCSFRIPLEAVDCEAGRTLARRMRAESAERLEALASRGPAKNNLRDQLRSLAAVLRTGGGEFKESPSAAASGWGALFEEAHAAAKEAIPLARALRDSDESLLEDTLALLSEFARSTRERFSREGLVSFDGLLLLVRDLLASRAFPGIRADLQARYDAVLVDEFQDTDPVQGEIVLFLAEDGPRARAARDVKLKPGKLFIVGDPKQSIYSFRGADIVAYEELTEQILGQGGERVVLRSNFRNQAEIVETVNGLFPKIIVPNGRWQPPYEPISPTRERGPRVELTLFAKHGGAISSEEAREAEAAWIAERIGSEGMRFRDVAILLKALTDVHRIVEALRAAEIPYVVEGEKYFYTTQEVVDFVNLLAAIANPGDRVALAGVLRSPMGALDDRTLYEIRASLDYRGPAPRPELEEFWEFLRSAHRRSGEMGVAEFLDRLLVDTFVLEMAAAGFHGEQAVANLFKLCDAARAFESATGGTLAAFVQRVRAAMRDLEEEGESPLADEKLDAVKILSIHKSKGLEFPTVFLPDLHRQTRGGGEPPSVRFDWTTQAVGLRFRRLGDPAEAALACRERLRRSEEERRLLYVAMTRAMDRLILSGSSETRGGSFLDLLRDAGAPDVMEVRTVQREPARPRRRKRAEGVGDSIDWIEFDEAWRRREAMGAMRRLTSVSRMEQEDRPPARGGSPRGTEIGIACHAILERMDFARPGVPDADPEVREILERFLGSPAFRELAESEILARELPFLLPWGDRIVEGFIDVVYRHRGKVYVGDYKTDVAMHPEDYRRAAEVYTRAVREATGWEVAGFRLLYLRHGRIVGTEETIGKGVPPETP